MEINSNKPYFSLFELPIEVFSQISYHLPLNTIYQLFNACSATAEKNKATKKNLYLRASYFEAVQRENETSFKTIRTFLSVVEVASFFRLNEKRILVLDLFSYVMTDEHISELANLCPDLQKLTLNNLAEIKTLTSSSFSKLPAMLETLALHHIHFDALHLSSLTSTIKHLSFQDCSTSDETYLCFSKLPEMLKTLRWEQRIKENDLAFLPKNLEKLSWLPTASVFSPPYRSMMKDSCLALFPKSLTELTVHVGLIRINHLNNLPSSLSLTILYPNGEKYVGGWKTNKRHGYGFFYYSNGKVRYKGFWNAGKKNGQGIFYNANGKKIYEGEWKDGQMHGIGTYYYADGAKYEGEWKDGQKHGQGAYYYADGAKYEGEWKDDQKHGQGTFYSVDEKKVYKGELQSDQWHGQGTFYSLDGKKVYKGEWKDNQWDGQGTFYNLDGNKYRGEFKNGSFNGQGTFYYANGTKYEGEWKDGHRHGIGILYSSDGKKVYEGEWKDDQMHGQGTCYWSNGNRYKGEWKDGSFNGQGTFYYADGTKYKGELRGGMDFYRF